MHMIRGLSETGEDGQSDSDDVLKDLLRDGAIGSAVGTAAGAGVSLALAAANLTVFIASPLVYLLGWGAGLGGLLGAMVGSSREKGDLPTLIKSALASGQVVLVVHAVTEEETTSARQIVTQSIDPPASRGAA